MRRLTAAVALTAALLSAAPAAAQTSDNDVIDEPPPPGTDLAGFVHALEPRVVELEPRIHDLKPRVRDLRSEVTEGETTTVTISADVLFAFDSAKLTDAARRVVKDVAKQIARSQGEVSVVGHTDSIGSDSYNLDLSQRRADSVATVLARRLAGRRIATEGRGESEPVAPNEVGGQDNPAGRAQNRRVEISFETQT